MNQEINEILNKKYIGRRQYISEIERFISSDYENHLHFYGIGGIGKSSLKKVIQQKLNENNKYVYLLSMPV